MITSFFRWMIVLCFSLRARNRFHAAFALLWAGLGLLPRPAHALGEPSPLEIYNPPVAYGGRPFFLGAAGGPGGGSYQWFFDGQPIPGATQSRYNIAQFSAANVGVYKVELTKGITLRREKKIDLGYWQTTDWSGIIDPSFHPQLGRAPSWLRVQSDGKVLAAGSNLVPSPQAYIQVVRFNVDGSLDTDFFEAAKETNSHYPGINILPLQNDGKIFLYSNGGTVRRLNADGTTDPTFRPASTVPYPVLPLTDGRYLGFESSPQAIVYRFLSDGTRDPSYLPLTIPTPFPYYTGTAVRGQLDGQGRVWLNLWEDARGSRSVNHPYRLQADGTFDPSFRGWPSLETDELTFGMAAGKILYTTVMTTGQTRTLVHGRLNDDGSDDLPYKKAVDYYVPPGFYGALPVAYSSDGSSYVVSLTAATDTEWISRVNLVRFTSEGQIDPTASIDLPADMSVTNLAIQPDGQVLIGGWIDAAEGVASAGFMKRIRPPHLENRGRISNLSVRSFAGANEKTLIAGFVAKGTDPISILARGAGPSLAQYGLTTALADPRLTLYNGAAQSATNDNWEDGDRVRLSAVMARVGAFPFIAGSKDSALLTTLVPGAYTAHVSSANSLDGIALAEFYDTALDSQTATASRLVNISGRAYVGGDESALIAGFVVAGTTSKRLMIRGVGPGLTPFGISGAMADPKLTLYKGSAAIATNDNWSDSNEISTIDFSRVGAFPLPRSSKDAVIYVSVEPGAYTAVVTSAAATSGVALVEVFEVE